MAFLLHATATIVSPLCFGVFLLGPTALLMGNLNLNLI